MLIPRAERRRALWPGTRARSRPTSRMRALHPLWLTDTPRNDQGDGVTPMLRYKAPPELASA